MRSLRVACVAALAAAAPAAQQTTPFHDYRGEKAGAVHRITVADLPKPFDTPAAQNPPKLAARPQGAMPQVMPGYTVTQYAGGFDQSRQIRTAPNGDLFVVESRPGRVKVLRGTSGDGRAETIEVFASDLNRPFGVAFYPPGPKPTHVYVANTDSIVRFPYRSGDLKARGAAEVIVPALPSGGQLPGGGHWTRDLVFSRDGRKMFVGVGSLTNVDDPNENPAERDRATILEFNADGTGRRVYASGIRNPAGLAIHPRTGQLWASVNERDGLGDNLVPDYITRVDDGAFFGWPWFYMGGHADPRLRPRSPELQPKVRTPDVLIQPHSASLGLAFYTATQFPVEHRNSLFAAQHGSWNRSTRTGYKVIRVPLKGDAATGEYQDFVTGFVTEDGQVWGRPVGVAVAADGSLFVSDDGTNAVWRVSYGKTPGQ